MEAVSFAKITINFGILLMIQVIKKINEERTLTQRFLHHSTLPRVEHLCSEILVNEQLEKISIMCREVVQKEMINGFTFGLAFCIEINSSTFQT
jgi:hypothetical protein